MSTPRRCLAAAGGPVAHRSVATTTSAAAAAATAATAASAAALIGFVDPQTATTEVLPVEGPLCFFRHARIVVLHESEAARAARLSIDDHIDRSDGAVLLKQFSEIRLGRVEGKIPYVQLVTQL